jgi:hypothetical protein
MNLCHLDAEISIIINRIAAKLGDCAKREHTACMAGAFG